MLCSCGYCGCCYHCGGGVNTVSVIRGIGGNGMAIGGCCYCRVYHWEANMLLYVYKDWLWAWNSASCSCNSAFVLINFQHAS